MNTLQEALDKLNASLDRLDSVVSEKIEREASLKEQAQKMTALVNETYQRIDSAIAKLEQETENGDSQL
ncbi:MAG: hypothetical protein IJC30_00700 [Alphaproteobacteria bacterium]|nr:hypothetical protein [Alphaproteobacteria bacterium]